MLLFETGTCHNGFINIKCCEFLMRCFVDERKSLKVERQAKENAASIEVEKY